MKILCDLCKREFESEKEDMDSLQQVLCPDCVEDAKLTFE
jgi:DNA-directed RNA polymerase subunit RPC12/RpoP